jgi:uncharacterized protein YbjQ (UPF0145 family)
VSDIAEETRAALAGRYVPDGLATLTDDKEDDMNPAMVTTGLDIPGHRVTQSLGVVRGITVRSRSVLGNIAGGLQSLFGGNITIYTELCEKARSEAFELLIEHATAMGADAVVAMRYDANEVMDGITEVLAYGTAVKVTRA